MRTFENESLGTISSQATQEWAEGSTHRVRSPQGTVKPHECAAIKQCTKCGQVKPLDSFDRKRSQCKRCRLDAANQRYAQLPQTRQSKIVSMIRWRVANPEVKRQCDAIRYERDRELILRQKQAYHERSYTETIRPYKSAYNAKPEVIASKREYNQRYHVEYYAKHKAEYLAKYIARRSLKARALPSWANLKKMESLYGEARRLTALTGIKHEVDHIIPLTSDVVCGLHVEINMRVITRYQNRKKSNCLFEDIC